MVSVWYATHTVRSLTYELVPATTTDRSCEANCRAQAFHQEVRRSTLHQYLHD